MCIPYSDKGDRFCITYRDHDGRSLSRSRGIVAFSRFAFASIFGLFYTRASNRFDRRCPRTVSARKMDSQFTTCNTKKLSKSFLVDSIINGSGGGGQKSNVGNVPYDQLTSPYWTYFMGLSAQRFPAYLPIPAANFGFPQNASSPLDVVYQLGGNLSMSRTQLPARAYEKTRPIKPIPTSKAALTDTRLPKKEQVEKRDISDGNFSNFCFLSCVEVWDSRRSE